MMPIDLTSRRCGESEEVGLQRDAVGAFRSLVYELHHLSVFREELSWVQVSVGGVGWERERWGRD